MKFSIITPSFRSNAWLKLCISSVADQDGVPVEHIVQDACSDDGTGDWLPTDPRVSAHIEKDNGMYDAVNRGFDRSSGDLLAYINCDEQYLPGALKKVHDCFDSNPEVDVVVSDFIVVDADGKYMCHRYATIPTWAQTWERFSISTCSLFIRRRVFTEFGLRFDSNWRDAADTLWILAACARKVRWKVLREFTSAFTDTGDNMNLKPNAVREKAEILKMRPWWIKAAAPFLRARYRYRLIRSGMFQQKPFRYEIYTKSSPDKRLPFEVTSPTGTWRTRVEPQRLPS